MRFLVIVFLLSECFMLLYFQHSGRFQESSHKRIFTYVESSKKIPDNNFINNYLIGYLAYQKGYYAQSFEYFSLIKSHKLARNRLTNNAMILGEFDFLLQEKIDNNHDDIKLLIVKVIKNIKDNDYNGFKKNIKYVLKDKIFGNSIGAIIEIWGIIHFDHGNHKLIMKMIREFEKNNPDNKEEDFLIYNKAMIHTAIKRCNNAFNLYNSLFKSTVSLRMLETAVASISMCNMHDQKKELLNVIVKKDENYSYISSVATFKIDALYAISEIMNDIGLMWKAESIHQEAISFFRIAQYANDSDRNKYTVAKTLLEQGNESEAEKIYQSITGHNKFVYNKSFFDRSSILEKNSKYDEAIDLLRSCTSCNKHDVEVFIGNLYRNRSRFLDALKHYDNALEYGSKTNAWVAAFEKGVCYYEIEDYQSAHSSFMHGIELNGDPSVLMSAIGKNYIKMKNYDNAIDLLQASIIQLSTDINILYDLSFALYMNNDFEKSLYLLEMLVKIDPFNYDFHGVLADVYLALHRKRDAIFSLRKMLLFHDKDQSNDIRKKICVACRDKDVNNEEWCLGYCDLVK